MNETRFKELLNLYLDHRLSAEEAAELEEAVRAQPALKRRLRAYEMMNMGCAELFRRSEADAPAPDALVRALRKAEERMCAKNERRAVVHAWLTWGTAAGAAAVVALMVARVSQPGTVSQAPVVAVESAQRGDNVALATARTGTVPVGAVSAAAVVGARRAALPEHLTLVALGITPETAQSGSSLSDWSATVPADASGRAVATTDSTPSWMAAARMPSGPEWGTSRPVSANAFSSRPLSGWGQSASGFQVQTAGYTFER